MVTKVLLVAFPTVLTVFFIIYLVFFFWKGGINSRVGNDERTEISGTKSARKRPAGDQFGFVYLSWQFTDSQ